MAFTLLVGLAPLTAKAAAPIGGEVEVENVSIEQQLPLLIKTLSWDRNFSERTENGVRLGLVYVDSDTSVSALNQAVQIAANWREDGGPAPEQSDVVMVELFWTGARDLASVLDTVSISALYILPGNESHLQEIVSVANKKDVPTLSAEPDWIKQGAALGVAKSGGTLRVLLNPKSAKKQGLDFEAGFLNVALIVE